MQIGNDYHLTYCTNIHPGFDWGTTFRHIRRYVPEVKARVAGDRAFGLGLRLSNTASAELGTGGKLSDFKAWLSENDVYVFTVNGFPYGNFHGERVKDKVHAPDWTDARRIVYTKRLFDQLAALLPDGLDGGVSTSPVSYRHWHRPGEPTRRAFAEAAAHLAQIVAHLHGLERATGKYLHLDIEPEPDGMLENSDDVLQFFSTYLLPIAGAALGRELGVSDAEARALVYRHIAVCYDVCHFALAYEEPADTFAKLARAGIRIGKIQVSAALKIRPDPAGNAGVWEALSLFDEPTYLHQVTERSEGVVKTYGDLPAVLRERHPFEELRAHFHVPIFLAEFGTLQSTQDHILKVVTHLRADPVTRHLEIETYTWDVLPAALKRELAGSIAREIEWFADKLTR